MDKRTLSLWIFAARYRLPELEAACRSTREILLLIKERFLNPQHGLGYFLELSVPLETLAEAVRDITKESVKNYNSSVHHCTICRGLASYTEVPVILLCDVCKAQFE